MYRAVGGCNYARAIRECVVCIILCIVKKKNRLPWHCVQSCQDHPTWSRKASKGSQHLTQRVQHGTKRDKIKRKGDTNWSINRCPKKGSLQVCIICLIYALYMSYIYTNLIDIECIHFAKLPRNLIWTIRWAPPYPTTSNTSVRFVNNKKNRSLCASAVRTHLAGGEVQPTQMI